MDVPDGHPAGSRGGCARGGRSSQGRRLATARAACGFARQACKVIARRFGLGMRRGRPLGLPERPSAKRPSDAATVPRPVRRFPPPRRETAVAYGGVLPGKQEGTFRDGGQLVVRFVGPGEMFGTMALFTDRQYPAEAVSVVDSIEVSWTEAALLDLIRELLAHRHRGSELIYDAYNLDIGTGD